MPNVSDFLFRQLDKTISRDTKFKLEGKAFIYPLDMPNILREIYIISSSLKLLGENINKARKFVKTFKKNGGYGLTSPTLRETYYCISVNYYREVIPFIMQHECKNGGFTKIPNGFPPYLEETFYALQTFRILGHRYFSARTLNYLFSLQNRDGGFRRSIHMRIYT